MNIDRNSRNLLIKRWAASLAACGALFAATALAQPAWKPDRAVEIVVGSAPGGGNDKMGRMLLRIWQQNKWLEDAAVINKVGGSGAVAYNYIGQGKGDGHRIAVARTGLLTNHILKRSQLNYTDLTPIALVADDPMSLTVRADSQIKNVKDLIETWKTDPQSVSISLGSSVGSTTHFLVALVAKSGGVDPRKLKVLTFGGSTPSITNLLGGHIDMVCLSARAIVPLHKAGKLRMIGVASNERLPALPDVPTVKEQGIDVVQGGWTLMVAPGGLSPAQVAYWEDLLERTVNHADFKKTIERQSSVRLFMKSQPMRDFLKKEYETDRDLLIELGMVK